MTIIVEEYIGLVPKWVSFCKGDQYHRVTSNVTGYSYAEIEKFLAPSPKMSDLFKNKTDQKLTNKNWTLIKDEKIFKSKGIITCHFCGSLGHVKKECPTFIA